MKSTEFKTFTKKDGSVFLESTGLKGEIPVTILIFSEEEEFDERSYLKFLSQNPALNFLNEPEENVYTQRDGKPFKG